MPAPHAAAGSGTRCWPTPRVKPIGLGARDSLRLEAGLPLYGHDLDETTSPVEAALSFAVSKRRREAARLPAAPRASQRELAGELSRVRVGLKVLEGAPAREGAEIADADGAVVGRVTSGGFSPTLGRAIAMGYVPPALAAPGARLERHRARQARSRPRSSPCPSFPTATTARPEGALRPMRFTKDHEWVEVDGDVATIGITAYAAEQLGDVVFVETARGRQDGQGRATASRWSRASRPPPTSTRRSPARWSRPTPRCRTRPRRSTPMPEGQGWFAKLKLADPAELDALMDRAAYEQYLAAL